MMGGPLAGGKGSADYIVPRLAHAPPAGARRPATNHRRLGDDAWSTRRRWEMRILKGRTPGLRGSYEALFHAVGLPNFWLDLRAKNDAADLLREERLERAVGVIYRPETERWSHYFSARLPDQFDALIHLDKTRAVEPLERESQWDRGELPETYPAGV
jgi:hypothetical protein